MSSQLQYHLFDLPAGIKARDYGLNLVESNNGSFVDTCRKIARHICKRDGIVSIDDVREVIDNLGMEPCHPNAFGSVFTTSEWRPVGYIKSKIPSNRARTIRTWSLTNGH